MKPSDDVRRDVAESYTQAVARPSAGGCCCCEPVPKGVVVQLGGYTREQLAALPRDAVVNSFGCGNPVAMAELGAGEIVLDLGSGAGIDLFLAAKRVGPGGRVIGIDMTEAMLARARENIAAGGFTNVEVRRGLIEELPVDSASVDWVISNCVINLSPEKPRVFAEIARVLKPGGRMLVSDIVARDLPEEIRRDPALYSSCLAGAISEEEYVAGLRAVGLVDVAVRERLAYDAVQLAAFFAADPAESSGSGCCCGGGALVPGAVRQLEGKVWSAKVFARKPG